MSDKPPPYPEQQPPPGAYPQPGFAPQQPGYPQQPGILFNQPLSRGKPARFLFLKHYHHNHSTTASNTYSGDGLSRSSSGYDLPEMPR